MEIDTYELKYIATLQFIYVFNIKIKRKTQN